MFLQLHISEKTGRGIPKIIDVYGKNSIAIEDNTITVTIPFTRLNQVGDKEGNKEFDYIERIGSRKTGYWHVKID